MAGDEPEKSQAAADRDPFVVQLEWIKGHYGSWKELAETSQKVGERTLIGWVNGEFPKSNSSPAVQALHRWAEATLPGYPQAAGVPALTETSGRRRVDAADRADLATAAAPLAADQQIASLGQPGPSVPEQDSREGAVAQAPDGALRPQSQQPGPEGADAPADSAPRGATRRRWSRTGVVPAVPAVVAVVILTLVAVVIVVILTENGDAPATAIPDSTGTAAATDMAVGPPPGTPGASTPETTGTIGAKTYGDPFQLSDPGLPIPAETTVDVQCRRYAPSIGSVQPDGYWYLVLTSPWARRWAPANSFLNGDRLGGPTEHNTDFNVPDCD